MPALSPPVLTRNRALRWLLPAVALVIDLLLWGGQGATRLSFDVPWWVVVLIALPVYASLAARNPLVGLVVLTAFGVPAGLLLPYFQMFLGLALALFAAARWSRGRLAGVLKVLVVLPLAVNAFNAGTEAGGDVFDRRFALISFGLWCLLFGVIALAGRALARGDARLQRERSRAETQRTDAVKAERLRISRELHDNVGHALTAIIMRAAGSSRGLETGTVDTDEVRLALADIQQAGSQSMRELHRLLGMLREAEHDDLAADSAPATVIDESAPILEAARAAGFRTTFAVVGEPQALDPSVAQAASRALREGVTNAIKYAVPGTEIGIQLRWITGRLQLTVTNEVDDDRVENAPFTGGFGLVGLTERAHIVGGEVATNRAGNRYTLEVSLPTVGVNPES